MNKQKTCPSRVLTPDYPGFFITAFGSFFATEAQKHRKKMILGFLASMAIVFCILLSPDLFKISSKLIHFFSGEHSTGMNNDPVAEYG